MRASIGAQGSHFGALAGLVSDQQRLGNADAGDLDVQLWCTALGPPRGKHHTFVRMQEPICVPCAWLPALSRIVQTGACSPMWPSGSSQPTAGTRRVSRSCAAVALVMCLDVGGLRVPRERPGMHEGTAKHLASTVHVVHRLAACHLAHNRNPWNSTIRLLHRCAHDFVGA